MYEKDVLQYLKKHAGRVITVWKDHLGTDWHIREWWIEDVVVAVFRKTRTSPGTLIIYLFPGHRGLFETDAGIVEIE